MIDLGKKNVLGIGVSAIDYDGAVAAIVAAARDRRSYKAAALAVHGVMTGVLDREHRWRLNGFDLIAPDGQPVRWAMNLMHAAKLQDRVYGPNLMLDVCERAAGENLPVYLYGSRSEVLELLEKNLKAQFPDLIIAGKRPSLFRRSTDAEKSEIAREIEATGARIVFVGLGCPRQEIWVHEYADMLACPSIAVGAAFDFHAGLLKQAPQWMQERGLEWLFRLTQEPRRLWRRYLYLNPLYVVLFGAQMISPALFGDIGTKPKNSENYA